MILELYDFDIIIIPMNEMNKNILLFINRFIIIMSIIIIIGKLILFVKFIKLYLYFNVNACKILNFKVLRILINII